MLTRSRRAYALEGWQCHTRPLVFALLLLGRQVLEEFLVSSLRDFLLRAVDGLQIASGSRVQLILLDEVEVGMMQAHVLRKVLVIDLVQLIIWISARVVTVAVLLLQLEDLVPRNEAFVMVQRVDELLHAHVARPCIIRSYQRSVNFPPAGPQALPQVVFVLFFLGYHLEVGLAVSL